MPHEHHMTDEMRRCIDMCHECHDICTETVPHCLSLGGEHAAPQHITTLLDCAAICETSADFMARGSNHHSEVCDVCATICRACEEECRRLGDDDMMQRCADTCARCAESCERMAAMA